MRSPAWLARARAELLEPANRALTFRLLSWVALQALVVNAILGAAHLPDVLWLGTPWSTAPSAASDSWRPISDATLHLRVYGTEGLYERVYFASPFQFIYSPQSLAFFDLSGRSGLVDWSDAASLNRASHLAFLALGVAIGLTGRALAADPAPGGPVGWVALGLVSTTLFFPAVRGLELGQIQTWLTLLTTLALLAHARGRPLTAGILIGIVMVVKPYLALALPWALLRRDWRLLGGQVAVLGLATVLSVGLYGVDVHRQHLELLSYLGQRGEPFHANHALSGLLHRAAFNGNNLAWDPWHRDTPRLPWVEVVSLAWAVVVIASVLWPRRSAAPRLGLAALVLATVVASPLANDHNHAISLPIFLALGVELSARGRAAERATVALAFTLSASSFAITRELAHTWLNPLQSTLFFASTALFVVLQLRMRSPLAAP